MNKSVKSYFLIAALIVIIFLFAQVIFFKKNKEISLNQSPINIDLITSVHPSLNWTFQPVKPKLKIKPGEVTTIEYFVKKCFNFVGLNYKKYLRINKNLLRPSKTQSLVADTTKAKRTFKFKIEKNLDDIISVMMKNDLKIEKNKK